ncbi:hypothetical protein ACFL35_18905 [Candidatus Riflebacteria bacterium]
MKIQRILTIGKRIEDDDFFGICTHLPPSERLSLLENLCRELAYEMNYKYPQRLSTVLEIILPEQRYIILFPKKC